MDVQAHRDAQMDTWVYRWMHSQTDGHMDGHPGAQRDMQADVSFLFFLWTWSFLGGGVDESCDKYRSPCQEGTEMQAVCRWECTWFAEPFPSCEQICVGSRRQEASG